ncbi:MAG TPA: ABC transporter permease [Bryobacteraceae bacterium]|nr:ABC transporter permease [Bryobacteraceae bacterium]
MSNMLQDIRLSVRRLVKAPGFSLVTVATLALAIGANTTTFSALNQFLLRPLPVERPKELVFLNTQSGITQSYPNYLDYRDRNRTLSGLMAYRIQPVGISQGGKNAHIWGYEATGNYFDVLGVHAMLGRTLTPEDDLRSSPHPVIVLSYTSWQNRFAGDPNIVGKTAKLNGLDYTIIGVAPRGFFGTEILLSPEFWAPMTMQAQLEPEDIWLDNRNTWNIWTVGRLKAGVSQKQAADDLQAIATQIGREHKENEGIVLHLSPPGLIGNALRGPVLGFATVLMALAGMVLLIACVNIAGMLLARAADRRKEISIRLSLGAPRSKLIRQLLTESLLLSVLGVGAGILVAKWILGLLGSVRMPISIPLATSLAFDTRVLVFTIGLCFVTTILFGLAPAIQASRVDLMAAMKNQVSERLRRFHVRDFLVGAQVALSLILLVGTVLVVRSLQRSVTIDIGFNPRNAVVVTFDMSLNGYSEERGKAFERRLMDELRTVPGVESYALSNFLPLSIAQSNTSIYAEGQEALPPSKRPRGYYYVVSPGYFHTMQTRMIAGREFTEQDQANSPLVIIVNQALAKKLYPNGDALGRRANLGGKLRQIVGIAQDGKYQSLNDEGEGAIFWPRAQQYQSTISIVARSPMPADDLVRRLQGVVLSMDGTMPFFQADSLEDHLSMPLLPARIAATLMGGFGLLAVVLAATGVYGMLAYSISRRTREIGIRVAIGATRANVLSLVLRRALVIVGSASVLGAGLALVVGPLFAPILYGVSPRDPETYALAVAMMGAIALVAAYVPARRALGIEAAVALREE